MKILLTGRYVSASGDGGGAGSYYKCLDEALRLLGHETVLTSNPEMFSAEKFDACITSHEKLKAVALMDCLKIHVCHGPYKGPEEPYPGADAYVSVSEEVGAFLRGLGFKSEVIRQPIKVHPDTAPVDGPGNVLFIKNNGTACLQWWKDIPKIRNFFRNDEIWGIKEIKVADRNVPVDEQIRGAKLVISLGRGALEAMAMSRCVIVADNRRNIGLKGDGYLDSAAAEKSMLCNYNGKALGFRADREWMLEEIKKYDPGTAKALHEHVRKYHDHKMIAGQFVELIKNTPRQARPGKTAEV